MKVITNNSLKIEPEKPLIPANEEVDLPKKLVDELLKSGAVRLPGATVVEEVAVEDNKSSGSD